jgi:DNA-binding MurR/RpiR family transcriptional regulator
MPKTISVLEKLELLYPELSPQLRRAARYIQKNPTEVALYSLRQVAAAANVSPTTLVRLATDLGFASYNTFRDAFRTRLKTGADRYAASASRLVAGTDEGGFGAIYEETFRTNAESLASLARTMTAEEIVRAGKLLEKAGTIYVLGLRPMFAAAFYFYYVMRTFSANLILVENRMGMLIDEIGPMTAADALLVISFEPYANDSIKAVEHAASVGAAVLALTDSTLSPLAPSATQALVIPTASTSFYQSLVPTMALLETIISFMLTRSGQPAVDRITAEFERRDQFGVYWRDPA